MIVYLYLKYEFQDIPDVEGDKLNGINSVALQIGKKPVSSNYELLVRVPTEIGYVQVK